MHADLQRLSAWAADTTDPIAALKRDSLDLPGARKLARAVEDELRDGCGLVRVIGISETDPLLLRLLFIAIGLEMGTPVGAYGRLYDVVDSGRSYRTEAIPVSQTNESTGTHTDSSNKALCPDFIALLCVRPARSGGMSRVTSALQARAVLAAESPELLELLHQPFIRDLVTPGSERTPQTVTQNAFPIFGRPPEPTFRYMRFWIERGHSVAGIPLSAQQLRALDRLDAMLEHKDHVYRFRLETGQMLFCDNTRVAHDRDAYETDPHQPRWLCRLWLAAHEQAGHTA